MERSALNLKKRNFFSEKYATVLSKWRCGVKNRSFVGFSPGTEVPKTIFDCGCQDCRQSRIENEIMKYLTWKIQLGLSLIALSALLYALNYLIFHDANYMFRLFLAQLGFLPI